MENKVAYFEIDSQLTLFLAQSHSSVPFIGKVVIKVLKGEAEILGYQIPLKTKIACNSSKEFPSLTLNAIHNGSKQQLVKQKYIKKLFEKLNIKADVPFDTAVMFLVQYLSPETKSIECNGPTFSYFKAWKVHINDIMKIVKNSNQQILITGAKNMGKSIFLTYLINTSLSLSRNIYCIDTDLGKPLFTLEGTVSLSQIITPILSNRPQNQKLLKSFLINDTSPKDKPSLYQKAIDSLHSYYLKIAKENSLLMINTHGWTDGLGCSLLQQITSTLKPSIIVSLETGLIMERHEYESVLYSESFHMSNPDINIIHVDQKDAKSHLQTTGKYKIKNIDELYDLPSLGSVFIPFDDIEFILSTDNKDLLNNLTKYELLSIFNAQYVGIVNVENNLKEMLIENINLKIWDEKELLGIEAVGFISNIEYDEGIHISMEKLNKDASEPMKYMLIPLSENIQPKSLADDPVSYMEMPYYYDTYSELNFTANKRPMKSK